MQDLCRADAVIDVQARLFFSSDAVCQLAGVRRLKRRL
jgi:hypothetical protein